MSKIHNVTHSVLIDLRNIEYWIVVNKTLSETEKGNIKDTFRFYWTKVFLKLPFAVSLRFIYMYILSEFWCDVSSLIIYICI